MTKITDLIEIKTGYAEYVNLVREFKDPDANRGRMTQYRPIQAHREAMDRLSRLLLPMDNRVYLLLGSYGTGKSHLCLMLANYLSRKSNEPGMETFFENWASQDPVQAEQIRTWRGDGRFLVALPEYGQGAVGDDFDSLVLRAIEKACQREEFTGFLDTHYKEAVRQLERWQEREESGGPTGAYRDFLDQLEQRYPDVTLDSLKDDLADFQQEALRIFKEIYRVAVDADFTYHADSLILILEDLLSNPAFKERYRGLVIIADEFGYVLDRGQISMDVLQSFAEMCKFGVEGSLLAFIGTGHKVSLRAYAGKGLSEADLNVVSDRVQDVPLRSEGIEDIIAAVVVPEKDHPVWQRDVEAHRGMFNQFVMGCNKAGIFNHLKGPVLRERIIENIYPMHPMATHCAIQLSKEIGSAARSVFTFFAGKPTVVEEGSYPWYIAQTDVLTGDELNLYAADLLARYFQNELRPENTEARETIRQDIRNYRASLKQVEDAAAASLIKEADPLVKRLLDIMLVYSISGVATTFDSLKFGLDCRTEALESGLRKRLDRLVAEQTLFLNPTTHVYEFRLAGTGRDIQQMIDLYVADPEHQPTDLAQAVVEIEKMSKGDLWLVANNHNGRYNEDKRLLRVFAQPGELETRYPATGNQAATAGADKIDYFTHLENELLAQTAWQNRYEGVAVYVLCETEGDIQRAKRAVEGNKSRPVIVGIPNDPIPIREALLRLKAALHIRDTENLDDWSLQERTRLSQDFVGDQASGYRGEFLKARQRYLEGKALTWYTTDGSVLVAQPKSPYEPADLLMTKRLYLQRNTRAHRDLNLIHVSQFGPGRNVSLIDAVNILVRTSKAVEVDTGLAVDTGQLRYLQKALAEMGVLVQTHKATGSLIPYRVETDTAKYAQVYPALAALLKRIRELKPGEKVAVRALVDEYTAPPHGQGPNALSLFLAVAIRAFGDGLRLQLDPTAWGAVTIQDAAQIFDLVDGKHPNAVLEYREITDPERTLINGVYNLFSEEPGAAGQEHAVAEAYGALEHWWSKQSNLAHATDIYPADDFPTTADLVKLLAGLKNYTPHSLILDELQTVYGLERQQAITDANVKALISGIEQDKASIEDGPRGVKNALLKRLMEPLEPESDLYGDYEKAIEAWYKALDDNQRDKYAYESNKQAPVLIEQLPIIVNLDTTFFTTIPKHFGFGLGAVDDWHSDRSDEYLQLFKGALDAIARNTIKVPEPVWKAQGIGVKRNETQDGAQVVYRGGVKLTVSVPEPGVRVYVTSTGDDPRDSGIQRQEVTDTWETTVNRSLNTKLVSQSADGAYGRVLTLSFVNDDIKYEVQPFAQRKLEDEEFKFVFPQDREALVVTIRSLLESAIERGLVERDAIAELLEGLAGQLSE
jgi:hypothetical protein